jgi:hypothetical protein
MDKLPKSYNKLNKKKLKQELLRQMNDNIFIVAENWSLNQLNIKTGQHLKSAESALAYKELVIEKYKTLLETSIEDL